ncbi:MAG: PIN domain-containing protein [Hyphomicrobiaceae bacterium]
MASFVAVLDANVLYPAPVRDILMEVAVDGTYQARWTERIHEEWIRNLLKKQPELDPALLRRAADLMNEAVPDCIVEGYEHLIDALSLSDPDDRHVLATAITAKADVIVTFNLRDFPDDILGQYDLEAQHPDEFLNHQ